MGNFHSGTGNPNGVVYGYETDSYVDITQGAFWAKPDTASPGTSGWELVYTPLSIENVDLYATGWGSYLDTQYSSGSPFALTASADTPLPNNKGSTIEVQKPLDIDTFYDGTTITGRNGDGLLITIEFVCQPATAAGNYIDVWIDIGGSVGEIYRRTISFPKGNNVAFNIHLSFGAYTLDTWEQNGGTVYVNSTSDCNMWNMRYVLTRTHKAR